MYFSNLCFLIFSVVYSLPLAFCASPVRVDNMSCIQCWWNPYKAWKHSPLPAFSPEGRASLNTATPGAALWLTAGHTGKIGNGMCVCMCMCEIVQACVWIIAQQLCAMQWINVAVRQATANISASLVRISLHFSLSSLLLFGTYNALHILNC